MVCCSCVLQQCVSVVCCSSVLQQCVDSSVLQYCVAVVCCSVLQSADRQQMVFATVRDTCAAYGWGMWTSCITYEWGKYVTLCDQIELLSNLCKSRLESISVSYTSMHISVYMYEYINIVVLHVCLTVRCKMLQSVWVYYSLLQRIAVDCSVLRCIAVYCSVLQCIAVYCSV